MSSLDRFLQPIYDSGIATAVREGATAFPWIESTHVLAVTIVVGTIVIVDLRLLGYSSHRRGARQLINELLPYTWLAFVVALVTGSLLFSSNALTYSHNTLFRAKMLVLLAAGINMAIFHATAHRRIVEWDDDHRPPTAARVAGATSLMLWIVVIVLGRWVGFTLY